MRRVAVDTRAAPSPAAGTRTDRWRPATLDDMTQLVEAGKVVPSIDETYPLRDVPQALRRFAAAHHKGKIVIGVR